MKLTLANIAKVLPVYQQCFPKVTLKQLWAKAQPRQYSYNLKMTALPVVIMCAFLRRAPSTQNILQRWGTFIGIRAKSTLSDALQNLALLRLVTAMRQVLEGYLPSARSSMIVVLDSVAMTLRRTSRSNCSKLNNNTVGGGILWAYYINARPGRCCVQLLKIMESAWHDGNLMRGIKLLKGPLYIMDRGFFCLDLVRTWTQQQVRFIMRGKKRNISYELIKTCGRKRKIGQLRVDVDAVVLLGKKNPVKVRLVWATRPCGEDLILISGLLEWSAGQLLEHYRMRWQIERFHNVLKEVIGLAHLYSFQQAGMQVLAQIAFMLAMLLWMGERSRLTGTETVATRLRALIRKIRRQLDSETVWKRNMGSHRYTSNPKLKAA